MIEPREHANDDTLTCWCSPTRHVVCQQCDGDTQGCWNCSNGIVALTLAQAQLLDGGVIVLHRDAARATG